MQLTDVKCETCFSSPCSSEKPCVSHKCSHGKLGSFVPGLMLGVRKCGDDHHSHSVRSLTSWGTGLFISFQCLCSQSPCSSAFSLSCSLRASRWFLGRKEEAPTRNNLWCSKAGSGRVGGEPDASNRHGTPLSLSLCLPEGYLGTYLLLSKSLWSKVASFT